MKKLWEKNRVLFVLIITLIVCFIAIVSVSVSFFYSRNVSPYGDRVEDIKKHPISNKVKDKYKETVLDNAGVEKVNLHVSVRTIYIDIYFDETVDLDAAKNIAEGSLSLFGKKILAYYDVEFTLHGDDYTIIGAKNTIIDHVSWNNNTKITSEDKEDTNEEN